MLLIDRNMKKFAEEAGIRIATIKKCEKTVPLNIAMFFKICLVLYCSMDDI